MEVCPIFPFCNGEDGRASVAAAPCRRSLLGKMNEEQASIAAAPSGDNGRDAGELTRPMVAHGQRPAASRHAPRLSVARVCAGQGCGAATVCHLPIL